MLNNIEIENSLIEMKDNIEGYNPEILVNGNFKNIKSKVIRNLDNANSFGIAISYVVWSGLSLICSKLEKYDNNSRFLVTTEGYVTCGA